MFSPQDALPLPLHPNLDQYKKRAKDLVKAANNRDPKALEAWAKEWVESLIQLSNLQIPPTLPVQATSWIDRLTKFTEKEKSSGTFPLSKAQFLLARAHGFESWPRLTKHIVAIEQHNSPTKAFEQAAEAIVTGDLVALQSLLTNHPTLPQARSPRQHQATLLHYIAANGVEGYRQKTPPNAVEIAKLLLDAGADVNATAHVYGGQATTLALAATSIHPEQAGLQQTLIELFLARGASLNDPTLVTACLANGRQQAAEFLANQCAPLTIESAAGIGDLKKVKSYFDKEGKLTPNATEQQLHRALLWAGEYGKNEVIEFLLDHGAPLDAHSPDGQTPLHWAVIGGHIDTIQLLISKGASLEAKNSYGGTPLSQAHWCQEHGPKMIDYKKVIEILTKAATKSEWERGESKPPRSRRIPTLKIVRL